MKLLPTAFSALTKYKQFIIYKLQPRPNYLDKYDKIPVDHHKGIYKINPLDPSNWIDVELAIEKANSFGNDYGVGFVLTEDDPFWFLDIDNCLLKENEKSTWSELAYKLAHLFSKAAIEVSSSKNGLHIIGSGIAPSHSCKNSTHNIEFYDKERFIALTGINANGDAHYDYSDILPILINEYFTPKSNNSTPTYTDLDSQWNTQVTLGTHPNWHGPTDDESLIRLICNSKNILNKFNLPSAADKASAAELFRNDPKLIHVYNGDLSRMDLALAQHLAFWTGNDCVRIERLMRCSKLRENDRSKWDDRKDYLCRTILKACNQQLSFYNDHKNLPALADELKQVYRLQKRDYPELSTTSKPLNTHGNLEYLLNKKNILVRWNDMSRSREITIPDFSLFYDDQENSALNEIINIAVLNNMPITRIDEHLNSIAQKNHYHPIVECIESNPWDKKPRLEKFLETINSTNNNLSRILIRKWMLSAIKAIFSPNGIASQGVLVLQGKQNIGKTTWINKLDPINCNAVKTGALIDPSNKDSIITCACHWIVELGELDATFRKSDMARIKSYITNQYDIVRAAYARKNSTFIRRTVFAATVNESIYLIDTTGNRRWWTIEVIGIDNSHNLDMQQVWAEVYYLLINGAEIELTSEELNQLNKLNKEHELIDPFEDKLLRYFDWNDNWRQRSTLELTASEVLGIIGYDKPTRADATRMGKILMEYTGKKPNRRLHIIPQRKI